MFGDKKFVVDGATHLHSKIHNHHTALSYHQIQEAIAYNMVALYHVYGGDDPVDILSKHWSYINIWVL